MAMDKVTNSHLIMGVTSTGVDALSTPPSHAVYQSLRESVWYCLPLCHKANVLDWWEGHGYFEVYVPTCPIHAQWGSSLANKVANPSC